MRTRSGRLSTLMPLLRVEAGYRFAAAARYAASEREQGADGELPVGLAPLGALQRDAVFLRVVGMVRF